MKLKKKTKPFAHKFLGKLVITSGITRSDGGSPEAPVTVTEVPLEFTS